MFAPARRSRVGRRGRGPTSGCRFPCRRVFTTSERDNHSQAGRCRIFAPFAASGQRPCPAARGRRRAGRRPWPRNRPAASARYAPTKPDRPLATAAASGACRRCRGCDHTVGVVGVAARAQAKFGKICLGHTLNIFGEARGGAETENQNASCQRVECSGVSHACAARYPTECGVHCGARRYAARFVKNQQTIVGRRIHRLAISGNVNVQPMGPKGSIVPISPMR